MKNSYDKYQKKSYQMILPFIFTSRIFWQHNRNIGLVLSCISSKQQLLPKKPHSLYSVSEK